VLEDHWQEVTCSFSASIARQVKSASSTAIFCSSSDSVVLSSSCQNVLRYWERATHGQTCCMDGLIAGSKPNTWHVHSFMPASHLQAVVGGDAPRVLPQGGQPALQHVLLPVQLRRPQLRHLRRQELSNLQCTAEVTATHPRHRTQCLLPVHLQHWPAK
jgi:hypothetical protein